MSIFGKVAEVLSSNKNIKKELEELKGKVEVQDRLLKDSASPTTYASSQARESKTIEDVQGTIRTRVNVKQLQKLYLFNQFIFRGVNIRADELICRGFDIVSEDENAVKKCQDLIDRSGGTNLFWQLSINTDICGDGYLEKVYTSDGKDIKYLRHINPAGFGFLTYQLTNDIIFGEDKTPKAYMQIVYDDKGIEQRIEVPKDRISHLIFNGFADEFNGVSSIQPVYNTAIRLMNMEHAAAEAAVKTANPLFVAKTKCKSPIELAKWNSVLDGISAKDVVGLPDGMELDTISPGNQNFEAYSGYFLDAVVAALGIPKSILTGTNDSSSGNRGTAQVQSKHFYSVIRSNQRYVASLFNDIFADYGKRAGFKSPVYLVFGDIAEDADTNAQHSVDLYTNGIVTLEEARAIVGLDTTEDIKNELSNSKPVEGTTTSTASPDTKEDIKFWNKNTLHPQKGNKAKQKLSPTVPSVK
jgi:hypothetical protein